jgi:Zn finger protein HypA/HybF involved in hydrogenase expression
MHEGGVAHGLLDQALARAAGKRLRRIAVRVGVLSGVAPESLEMHFEAALVEHDLDGVAVEIHPVPARIRCVCGSEFAPARFTDPCPACASLIGRTILAGRDCELEAVDLA